MRVNAIKHPDKYCARITGNSDLLGTIPFNLSDEPKFFSCVTEKSNSMLIYTRSASLLRVIVIKDDGSVIDHTVTIDSENLHWMFQGDRKEGAKARLMLGWVVGYDRHKRRKVVRSSDEYKVVANIVQEIEKKMKEMTVAYRTDPKYLALKQTLDDVYLTISDMYRKAGAPAKFMEVK
jgi:hypothetical protein